MDSNNLQLFRNASGLVSRINDQSVLTNLIEIIIEHINSLSEIDGTVIPLNLKEQAMAQIMPNKLKMERDFHS